MAQRKTIHCPEDDDDCADPQCSVRVCVQRQARVGDEQRRAKQEAELQAQLQAQRRQNAREQEMKREVKRRRIVRRRAAMSVLREHVKEHNARIERNEPGIAKGRDGEILNEKAKLPDGKARQALIAQLFESASQGTEWTASLKRTIAEEDRKLRRD